MSSLAAQQQMQSHEKQKIPDIDYGFAPTSFQRQAQFDQDSSHRGSALDSQDRNQTGVMVVGMGMQAEDLHQGVKAGFGAEEEKTDVLAAA